MSMPLLSKPSVVTRRRDLDSVEWSRMGFDVAMMLCMAAGAAVGKKILFVCSIAENIVILKD